MAGGGDGFHKPRKSEMEGLSSTGQMYRKIEAVQAAQDRELLEVHKTSSRLRSEVAHRLQFRGVQGGVSRETPDLKKRNMKTVSIARGMGGSSDEDDDDDPNGQTFSTGMPARNLSLQVLAMVDGKDHELAEIQARDEDLHREMQEDCDRMLNAVRMERTSASNFSERVLSRLAEVHQGRKADLDEAHYKWHSTELELMRRCDEYVADTRGLLEEDKKLHEHSHAYTQEICDEVCHLYNDLESERRYRMNKCEKLYEGVSFKLGEVRDAIAAERRLREDSQETLLEMFGTMGQTLQADLDRSRRARHQGTDRIIALMEDMLPKLDHAKTKGAQMAQDPLASGVDAKEMAHGATENMRKRRSSRRQSLLMGRT